MGTKSKVALMRKMLVTQAKKAKNKTVMPAVQRIHGAVSRGKRKIYSNQKIMNYNKNNLFKSPINTFFDTPPNGFVQY